MEAYTNHISCYVCINGIQHYNNDLFANSFTVFATNTQHNNYTIAGPYLDYKVISLKLQFRMIYSDIMKYE